MEKWIDDLLVLQSTDLRIKKMRVRLADIPSDRLRISEQIEHAKTDFAHVKEDFLQAEKEIKQVESEIAGVNEKIRSVQNQSLSVKKNEEYKALLHEIEMQKGRIGEFETKELLAMEKLDAANKRKADVQKGVERAEKSTKEGLAELDELERNLKAQIAKSEAERAVLAKPIDTFTLSIYDRLLSRGSGAPFVQVHNDNCGNCHLKLTPQTITDAKKGVVTVCENCGHLLYSTHMA